jgi:phosphonoacetaldehyde hydrolase
MKPLQDIRLVLFDWAGTIIDFGCQAPAEAFVEAFAVIGISATLAEARRPMGLHKKDHLRAMLQEPGLCAKWRSVFGTEWTEADVERLYQVVTPKQISAASKYSRLIPGLHEVVAELRRRGIRIATTTGYFQAAADVVYAVAQEQGFAPDFQICADEVPEGRPAPWMIFRCMEALQIYPPAAVLKIGDTPVDIQEGLNAGVWSVGVLDSSNEISLSEQEFAAIPEAERERRRMIVASKFLATGAHAVIRTIAELPKLLAN